MTRYQNLKVRKELVDILKRSQLPGEPLSDTLKALIDFVKVYEREREKERMVLTEKGNRKGDWPNRTPGTHAGAQGLERR